MKQYLIKKKGNVEVNHKNILSIRVESLYKKLVSIYGTKGVVLRASKLNAIELIKSKRLEDRVMLIQKILQKDPNQDIEPIQDIAAVLDVLEDEVAEKYAQKVVEQKLEAQIQKKMDEKYKDYIAEIKRQVIKEQDNTLENAQTLKKLGKLEKMERIKLNSSAFEILRPSTLDEIVGQEKAIKSLISKLSTPYPQHIILYGPSGVGKTTCARLALDIVKGKKENPFSAGAPFIEVDGTTLRWDPRESTNPLLGSVHDPIYQGAKRELADDGIPEPKLGLVSDAHGGILFIDEIGDMDPYLQNKLLKVLEDKRVFFESSYYDPTDNRIPQYIKKIFEEGVPADFVLIGATTRSREEINPAFRSRCMEIFFEPLTSRHISQIIDNSARKLKIDIEEQAKEIISDYARDGRTANKILIDAYALALNEQQDIEPVRVTSSHVYSAIQNSRIAPVITSRVSNTSEIGKIFGIGVSEYRGTLIEIEAAAFQAETKGQGNIRLNETAGSMVRDSLFNAVSVFRKEFGKDLKDYDIHINIVGGGKVDGPSAGVAIFLAILSAVWQRPLLQNVAVTGELSIQGRVKSIGGLYEKINGAFQAGIRKIIVPEENLKDIPNGTEEGIELISVRYIREIYSHVFESN
ncbi:MAG: ATP-dependent protease, Lon family [Syntrophomonadaceae bacterium]|nr:ATP-dependent protease, Lon family [Syntrophomonadaceae bacterium]